MLYGIEVGASCWPVHTNNPTWSKYWFTIPAICGLAKEVKVRGGKAPYAGNALKVMPIVPSPATFYDRERP
jgi:hypothetical protein